MCWRSDQNKEGDELSLVFFQALTEFAEYRSCTKRTLFFVWLCRVQVLGYVAWRSRGSGSMSCPYPQVNQFKVSHIECGPGKNIFGIRAICPSVEGKPKLGFLWHCLSEFPFAPYLTPSVRPCSLSYDIIRFFCQTRVLWPSGPCQQG